MRSAPQTIPALGAGFGQRRSWQGDLLHTCACPVARPSPRARDGVSCI